MRGLFKTLLFISFLIFIMGCTTIYKAAVDERSVTTIAADTKIKAGIVKRFIDDETVKALDISTSSYEGHVYLIGEYDKPEQQTRAVEIAKGVEGVQKVTAYMLPKKESETCTTAYNIELTARVKAKLVKDKDIWSTNVDVKTMQCIVVLWGLVGSDDEVKKAVNHAKSVEGVKSVKSFLRAVR